MMMNYRQALPQLATPLEPAERAAAMFISDGGLETDLIFNYGLALPEFASFVLLEDAMGTAALRRYFEQYVAIAKKYDVGLVLEAPTWRANSDWGTKLGYSAQALATANKKAIDLLAYVRTQAEHSPVVISGCLGPRGDGYSPECLMDAQRAHAYHMPQITTFADTAADMVSAMTMTYTEEAIGIVWAAQEAGMPVVISFTVETDGRLPSGQSLQAAIEQVDEATNGEPAYYMINCAHPSHFAHCLPAQATWTKRIYGIRANASRKSHAELDEAETLDEGNPKALGEDYVALKSKLHNLRVLGGCCGTDFRHVEAICEAYFPVTAV